MAAKDQGESTVAAMMAPTPKIPVIARRARLFMVEANLFVNDFKSAHDTVWVYFYF